THNHHNPQIVTPQRAKKDPQRRAKLLLGWALGFIMVSSTFGFLMGSSFNGNSITYGKYQFRQEQDNTFTVKIKGKVQTFYFLPDQLQNVNITGDPVGTLQTSQAIAISFVPNQSNAQGVDLLRYLLEQEFQEKGTYVIHGATTSLPALQQISCANASSFVPVIVIAPGNATSIDESDDCVTIRSPSAAGFIQAHDRLKYGMLGVME
ncbi:hypothetical protein COV94_06580, partial [Candidatus Woesearchaeota archaeon CG11_big_fil_rev_8_21_14_0_20_57_5]